MSQLKLTNTDRKIIEGLADKYVIIFSEHIKSCEKLLHHGIIERYDKPIRGMYHLRTNGMYCVTLTERGKVLALILGFKVRPYFEYEIGAYTIVPRNNDDNNCCINLDIYSGSYIHMIIYDPIGNTFMQFGDIDGKLVIILREARSDDEITIAEAYMIVNEWKKALAKHDDEMKRLANTPLGITIQLDAKCSKQLLTD